MVSLVERRLLRASMVDWNDDATCKHGRLFPVLMIDDAIFDLRVIGCQPSHHYYDYLKVNIAAGVGRT